MEHQLERQWALQWEWWGIPSERQWENLLAYQSEHLQSTVICHSARCDTRYCVQIAILLCGREGMLLLGPRLERQWEHWLAEL